MSVEVDDKVVMIPLQGGGKVAVKSGSVEEGDKVVMIPIAGGSFAAVKLASPEVGDKVVLYPLRGGGFACLMSDGELAGNVFAWGWNNYGQSTVPEGLVAVDIAAGQNHSMALQADGTVVCWGRNFEDQCDVPAGLIAVAISGGDAHSMALKADGTVICWGDDGAGQSTVPAGLIAVAISAGDYHSMALQADGTVICWGNDGVGQSTVPAGLVAVDISAGGYHSMALKANGEVVCWGLDTDGQSTVPAGLFIVDIAAGTRHSMALEIDGTVVCWGDDDYGQSIVPDGLEAVNISGGLNHSMALQEDGTVVCWGQNYHGQCTVPAGLVAVAISAGQNHSMAIKGTPVVPVPYVVPLLLGFEASWEGESVDLSWTFDPVHTGARIMRAVGHQPMTISDGVLVYEGADLSCVDPVEDATIDRYYGAFGMCGEYYSEQALHYTIPAAPQIPLLVAYPLDYMLQPPKTYGNMGSHTFTWDGVKSMYLSARRSKHPNQVCFICCTLTVSSSLGDVMTFWNNESGIYKTVDITGIISEGRNTITITFKSWAAGRCADFGNSSAVYINEFQSYD